MDLSIVIPIYNERENIPLLYKELKQVLEYINKKYEILFIDDGSTDNSSLILKDISSKDSSVKIINFRKNFGKSYALNEGFKSSNGKIIITLDGDLQDDPKEIPKFLRAIKKRDIVSGWKFKRKDPLSKTLPSKFANFITKKATKVKIHDMNCGFKAYRKEAAKSLELYGDMHRYIPAIASSMGFSVGEIKIEHRKRKFGKSKYGMMRIFSGGFDFLTIKFLTTYSNKPLHFFGGWGIIIGMLGFVSELYVLYIKLFKSEPFRDHVGLIIFGFILVVIGFQLVSLGLLGEMINKTSKEKRYNIKNL